ncbi:hypothetical protein LJK87_02715 [Paenibacillus sp. P25]|nr:hypothetical protein LJK87_02715 [Paenibacillus sp. P25]
MKKLHMVSCVMLCSMLTAACSGGGAGQVSPGSSPGGKAAGSGEVVTLKFMGWEASPLETQSVKKGLDLFMQQHPEH